MKKTLIILLSILIMFAGCRFDPPESDFDLTDLYAAIDEAELAMEGLDVAANASQVHKDRKWVTSNDMAALKAAITTAEKTAGKAASQSEVDDAVADLDTAISEFNTKKQYGTKTNGFSTDELNKLIKEAENLQATLKTSSNYGADVSTKEYWVTPLVMNTLTGAINGAKYPANIDSTYSNLVAALVSVYSSKKKGTAMSRSITIIDLTQHFFLNGTEIEVGLYENKNSISNWNPVISGKGSIRNDKATIILYNSSGNNSVMWTGKGLYYIGFRDNDGTYISKEKVNFSNTNTNPTISFYNFEPADGSSGTEQRAITVTGLNSFAGKDIEIGLFSTSGFSINEEPLYWGSTYIYAGSITVSLYEGDYYDNSQWYGNGQYYIRLCIGDYGNYSYYRSNAKVSFSNSTPNPTINFSGFSKLQQ